MKTFKVVTLAVVLTACFVAGGIVGARVFRDGGAPADGSATAPAAGDTAARQQVVPTSFMTIGTGGVTGVYYPAGGAICRAVNRQRARHGVRCLIDSTAGSVANLRALRAGRLDFAVAQSDWHFNAYEGAAIFAEDGPFTELRSVFALHAEPFSVVAKAGSDIAMFTDLEGRRVNVGNPGSGHRATMEVVMHTLGWSLNDFSVAAEFPSSDHAQALCQEGLDALVFMSGHPSGSIIEVSLECDSYLVPVDAAVVDDLVGRFPYYYATRIPGGLYRGTPEDVPTFGVGATFVTTAAATESVVYELVRAVFGDLETFTAEHPALMHLRAEDMRRDGLSAPLHVGAERYFDEIGLR